MKTETLNNYRDRLNRCQAVIHSALNGMKQEDSRYDTTMKLFNKANGLAQQLFGDEIVGSTVEISNRLQSLERMVHEFLKGLPVNFEENALAAAEQREVEQVTHLIQSEGLDKVTGTKEEALALIDQAKVSLANAYVILCSGHPGLKFIPQIEKINELIRLIDPAKKELYRIPL